VKIMKNKVAPPFKEAEVEIMFGRGIDRMGDLINIASDLEVVQKSGSRYSYGDTRLGQGKEKTAEFLNDAPDLVEEIQNKVTTILKGETGADEAEDEAVEAADPAKCRDRTAY